MKHKSSKPSAGGISFIGLLTILFIALKLLGVIGWSWWWVLSPLWIGPVIVIIFFGILWAATSFLSRR